MSATKSLAVSVTCAASLLAAVPPQVVLGADHTIPTPAVTAPAKKVIRAYL